MDIWQQIQETEERMEEMEKNAILAERKKEDRK